MDAITLAIDPGLRECGLAWFYGTELRDAVLVRSGVSRTRDMHAWLSMAERVLWAVAQKDEPDTVAYEMMHVYTLAQKSKANDDNDLLQLTGVLGCIGAGLKRRIGPEWQAYRPREWKGQVPKDVHQRRIRDRFLYPAELEQVESRLEGVPEGLQHNVWDAVGIGLFHVGRRNPLTSP